MKNYYNCIYMYINKINGRRYVGQAADFNRRHKEHIRKSTDKFPIDRAFNKYGIENFEIIILKENLSTQCLLNFWERYYIEKYNTLAINDKGYNISNGGSNGNNFAGKTEEEMNEIKRKMSDSHADISGKNNPMYGKHHSEETKKKLSEANKGENNPWYNKHLSEEHKQKMSENHADFNGKNNPRAKKVAQYDLNGNLIKIWDYIKQASDELGFSRQSINNCCKFWEINCNKEEWFKTHKKILVNAQEVLYGNIIMKRMGDRYDVISSN